MDDSLSIDGVLYISSKRAARESGYTKDYIGQLARAGKIDARLIGRSWYVREGMLEAYKKEGGISKQTPAEIKNEPASLPEDHTPLKNIHDEKALIAPPPVTPFALSRFVVSPEARARKIRQDALLGRINVRFSPHTAFEEDSAPLVPLIGKEKHPHIPGHISIRTVSKQTSPEIRTIQNIQKKKPPARAIEKNKKHPAQKNIRGFLFFMIITVGVAGLIMFAMASFFFEKSVQIKNTENASSRLHEFGNNQ